MFVKTFVKTGQIIDSKEVGNRLKVYMKFNSEIRDKEGDLFLKSAWNNEKDSLEFARKGHYDYNHLSVTLKPTKDMLPEQIAKAEQERLKAIIGKPDSDPKRAVYWSEVENGPITEGYLDGENEYVKSIKSLTKSGYTFEASAAGGIYAPDERTIAEYGKRTYDRAVIKHIAICPAQEAINPETFVLLKSTLKENLGIMDTTIPEQPKQATNIQRPSALQQFVLGSPGYAEYVYNGIISEMQKGTIPIKYEPIKNYFLEREIPEAEATECAELLLAKFKTI